MCLWICAFILLELYWVSLLCVFLNYIWEVFIHYFWAYFSCSFSSPGALIMCMLVHLRVGYILSGSVPVILFSLCSSGGIISITLAASLLIICSASSNLMFNPSSEFSFQLLHFSTPQFPFDSFNNFLLLIFPIWWDVIMLPLSVVFFCSLNTFTVATLKSWSVTSDIWSLL